MNSKRMKAVFTHTERGGFGCQPQNVKGPNTACVWNDLESDLGGLFYTEMLVTLALQRQLDPIPCLGQE